MGLLRKKNNMKVNKKMSDEDIEKAMKAEGAEIAFYLHRLNIKDEEKEVILAGLDSLSIEQLLKLKEILKEGYVRQLSKPDPDKIQAEIDVVLEKTKVKQKEIDDKALSELEKLRADIKTAEKENN
ncbi:MAG: hypothetical protein ABID45_03110 [Patescibacteria group bacterium]